MMADFQDSALQVISSSHDAVLGLEAGIAHEQEGDLVVGDFEDNRILVEVVRKGVEGGERTSILMAGSRSMVWPLSAMLKGMFF